MLEYDEVHTEMNKAVGSCTEKLKESLLRTENLNSSVVQINELANSVVSFKGELDAVLRKIVEENGYEAGFSLLKKSFDQLVDFVTDKPTVILFNIEKEKEIQASYENSIESIENALSAIASKGKKNERIAKDLSSGKNPRKRKPGNKPDSVSEVRKVKARLKNKVATAEDDK